MPDTVQERTQNRTAYHRGREAYWAGEHIMANPYRQSDTNLAAHWSDGWEDAQAEGGLVSMGPAMPNAHGHRYAGRQDRYGYGVCEMCGCTENSDESARRCPDGD